ncbi:RagB/SusD family nutrient uptake outer membrane protein [Spirosoma pulveris]
MKKTLLTSALLTALLVTGCKESFLEVKPPAVFDESGLQNRAGVNFLLIGAYSMLDGVGSGATSWHGSADNWIYGSVASDDAYKGSTSGDQPEITFIEIKNILSDNSHFRGKWRTVYDGVARANDVLRVVEKTTDLTDAEKVQIRAQARFLRGWYHFEAKRMFNQVPYLDEKTYNPEDPNSTKIPNDKDIWPNIEADFKFAYENLPSTQSQPGRATKWAAAASLAKAEMYQKNWADAKVLLTAVVNSGRYRLMERYHDNFRAAMNNNAESILEAQNSVNDGAGGGENGNSGATLNYPYAGPTTCCGFFQPSQNLVNAYKTNANGLPLLTNFNDSDVTSDQGIEGNQPFTAFTGNLDPRLDWTVGRRDIPFLDWGLMPGKPWIRDQGNGGPYIAKKHLFYRSDVGTNTFANNSRLNANNTRLIRYAHVLLMLAECEIELGNLEPARALVNQVRKRAANPDGFVKKADGTNAANYVIGEYTAPWTDATVARNALRFETRLELALEGHRFFDLVRWGIADQVLNAYMEREARLRPYFTGATFVKGKHEYYPIPLLEITNSAINGKPVLKQNPNY